MKKLVMSAMCAFGIAGGVFAAGEAYHVYKFQFDVKTTDAKGVAASSCCGIGDEYCYRAKSTAKIQGFLAGCGCEAIEANGACKNAILYMWDATHKVAITNVEVTIPWKVQRIDRKLNVVEHFAGLKAVYGENDRYGFEITMAGFGTYHEYKNDAGLSYANNINGNFAGLASAPLYLKPGVCTACYAEPDELFETTAFVLCEACSEGLAESETKSVTPFFGTYKIVYNSSLSKNTSKKGLGALTSQLPKYVGAYDFVATNIGE